MHQYVNLVRYEIYPGSHLPQGQAIAGMAILGIGAGITELTAVAGIAELAPVKKRGLYVAVILLSRSFFFSLCLNNI